MVQFYRDFEPSSIFLFCYTAFKKKFNQNLKTDKLLLA